MPDDCCCCCSARPAAPSSAAHLQAACSLRKEINKLLKVQLGIRVCIVCGEYRLYVTQSDIEVPQRARHVICTIPCTSSEARGHGTVNWKLWQCRTLRDLPVSIRVHLAEQTLHEVLPRRDRLAQRRRHKLWQRYLHRKTGKLSTLDQQSVCMCVWVNARCEAKVTPEERTRPSPSMSAAATISSASSCSRQTARQGSTTLAATAAACCCCCCRLPLSPPHPLHQHRYSHHHRRHRKPRTPPCPAAAAPRAAPVR